MAWLNGKEGVWRTVGGRKIFIATGQSLKDAMKASGKFKNLNDKKEEGKEDFKRGSKEHYDALIKGGMKERDAKHIIDLENGKKVLEEDSYGGYYRDKDYIDIPGFKDYEYNTKTGEVKVKDDVLKEANRQNRLRTAKANAEASAKEYEKYYSDYKKYADKANEAGYGTEEYQKYSAKRKEAYQKAMDAKVEALTEFNKTIPYDEMFDAAKEISGSKNITFEEPKLVKGRDSGSLYTTYRSNDIKQDTGVFSSVLKGARLQNFNSSLSISEDGELSYWGTMELRYQHNGGGTNGMEIMQYTYKSKTGWDITDLAGYQYKNSKRITTASGLADYYMEYYGYSREAAKVIAGSRMEELKRRDQEIDF